MGPAMTPGPWIGALAPLFLAIQLDRKAGLLNLNSSPAWRY